MDRIAAVLIIDITDGKLEQIADIKMSHIPRTGEEICLTTIQSEIPHKTDRVYTVVKVVWRIYPQQDNNFAVSIHVKTITKP